MAVVERTIDILGDTAFSAWLLSKTHQEGWPVDIYDDVVRSIAQYAMYRLGGVQSIRFTKVTRCYSYAAPYCTALVSLDLPLCTTIDDNVFRSCTHLTTLNLPELQSVGSYAFYGCTSLQEVNLPKLKTASAAGAFQECTALRTVILPRLEVVGTAMFYSCTSLEQIDLPSVKTIAQNAFPSATAVINIGPNITSINASAFAYTPAGVVINLPVAEGVISGAPWGNANAVINYEVPYAGSVPIPT